MLKTRKISLKIRVLCFKTVNQGEIEVQIKIPYLRPNNHLSGFFD